MRNTKTPFLVFENFISPLLCEDIVIRLNNKYPDRDLNNHPLKTTIYNNLIEIRLLPLFENLIEKLENYYGFISKGILSFKFEWFVENYKIEPPKCLSYQRIDKWNRINDISFTGILFLTDYNDTGAFDEDFEVNGGLLEFINHKISFKPKRGKLIFFPECPNFLNTNSPVYAGQLNQIRVHIAAEENYNYDMNKFPGNYKSWF